MQLDPWISLDDRPRAEHHAGGLRRRQVLPGAVAGRDRKAVQFRGTGRLDAHRRDSHLTALLGTGRRVAVHIRKLLGFMRGRSDTVSLIFGGSNRASNAEEFR